jgi:hypothetical protein
VLQPRLQPLESSKGFERDNGLVLHEWFRLTGADEKVFVAAVLVIAEHLVDCLFSNLLGKAKPVFEIRLALENLDVVLINSIDLANGFSLRIAFHLLLRLLTGDLSLDLFVGERR